MFVSLKVSPWALGRTKIGLPKKDRAGRIFKITNVSIYPVLIIGVKKGKGSKIIPAFTVKKYMFSQGYWSERKIKSNLFQNTRYGRRK